MTGGTDFGTAMSVKAVELVHSTVPRATRFAVLMSDNPVHPSQLKEIQAAAKSIGLTVLPPMVRTTDDFETAIASMKEKAAGAFIYPGGAPVSTQDQIVRLNALAVTARLPSFYPGRSHVTAGGLVSYGPSSAYRWKMAATYVDKILKGAKPKDLPAATNRIRTRHQPQDCQVSRIDDPADIATTGRPSDRVALIDQRGRLLVAALGFAQCSLPSYDRALWALRKWLDSGSGIGHVAVGMHRQGFDLQLTQYDERGWRARPTS